MAFIHRDGITVFTSPKDVEAYYAFDLQQAQVSEDLYEMIVESYPNHNPYENAIGVNISRLSALLPFSHDRIDGYYIKAIEEAETQPELDALTDSYSAIIAHKEAQLATLKIALAQSRKLALDRVWCIPYAEPDKW